MTKQLNTRDLGYTSDPVIWRKALLQGSTSCHRKKNHQNNSPKTKSTYRRIFGTNIRCTPAAFDRAALYQKRPLFLSASFSQRFVYAIERRHA